MRSCRRCLHQALAIVVVAVLAGQVGLAKPLPSDLVTAASLNDTQTQAVQAYVGPRVKQLTQGDADQVVAARSQLLAPLNEKGVGDAFIKAYAGMLLPPLSKALTSQRLIIRLNAMIVISHLVPAPTTGGAESAGSGGTGGTGGTGGGSLAGQVTDAAAVALKDKSPAVRYWGARALARQIQNAGGASSAQAAKVQQLLTAEVRREESAPVLQQVFLAMAAMGNADGHRVLFSALDTRLAYHVEHPHTPFMAEHAAMQALYVNLVKAKARGQTISDQIKALSGVAVRYYALAAQQLLHDKKLSDGAREDRVATANFCDQILRYALKTVGNAGSAPQAITTAGETKNWKFLNAVVGQWQKLLQQAPFNLPRQQVTLAKN